LALTVGGPRSSLSFIKGSHDSPEFFTTYLSTPDTSDQIHLGATNAFENSSEVRRLSRIRCAAKLYAERDTPHGATKKRTSKSWCKQFVGQVLNGMTLNRTRPQALYPQRRIPYDHKAPTPSAYVPI
jgi:hypothetical protein